MLVELFDIILLSALANRPWSAIECVFILYKYIPILFLNSCVLSCSLLELYNFTTVHFRFLEQDVEIFPEPWLYYGGFLTTHLVTLFVITAALLTCRRGVHQTDKEYPDI